MQFGGVVLGAEDELMSAMSSMNQSVDWKALEDSSEITALHFTDLLFHSNMFVCKVGILPKH